MSAFRARGLVAVLAGSLLFGGLALALAMPAQIAGAATQLVTNCNDSGAGLLLQAVLDAQTGDTIHFALSPMCSTIILANTIDITASLTIDGPGASTLAVSGEVASGGAFGVASGVTVTMSGLSIVDDSFSGIDNSGALTLTGDARPTRLRRAR